jgi:hypothetical protein
VQAMDNSIENVAVDARARVLFTDEARKNWITDPQLMGISRDADGGLDPRPMSGSPALMAANVKTPPNDGFYRQVGYMGAFGEYNWASDWTALSEYNVLSAVGGRNPLPMLPTVVEGSMEISLEWISGGMIRLTWENGTLESSETVDGEFTPVEGATSPMEVTPASAARYYRAR